MQNEVTAARAILGLDLQGFADAVGVHRSTAFRWEQKGRFPRNPHTRKFIEDMLEQHRNPKRKRTQRESAVA